MAIDVLAPRRLALVSLVEEERSPLLSQFLHTPGFTHIAHIGVDARTSTQRNRLAARIDAAIAGADRAVLFVAQGSGCLAAAWWARLSPQSYVERVAGALMFAPGGDPGSAAFASPRAALRFPSIVVGADDASQRLAGEWGSRLIDGPSPLGQHKASGRFLSAISRFTSAIVEHDVRKAERMLHALGDWEPSHPN